VEHLATKYEEDLKKLSNEASTFKGLLERHERSLDFAENKDKSLVHHK